MTTIRTAVLPAVENYISPGGAAEIRLLLQFPAGEITHATAQKGATSIQSWMEVASQWFYVLDGRGTLWDGVAKREIDLVAGRAVCIPAGTSYQYRATDTLRFLVAVMPQWRHQSHHIDIDQHWLGSSNSAAEAGSLAPGLQNVHYNDIAAKPNYAAPDGSLIYLLGDEASGGLAECILPPESTTVPVHHRTVEELWYVISGEGEISRREDTLPPELTKLAAGTCIDIGKGITFQFRNIAVKLPLRMLLLTMPRWPGPDEAVAVPALASWDF
jgi:mannose-6-phosphate isomerase-like protein (cupin superfamily)